MKTFETADLILYSKDGCVYVLEKQTLKTIRIKTNIAIERIPDQEIIIDTVNFFRNTSKEIDDGIRTVYLFPTEKCNLNCLYCANDTSISAVDWDYRLYKNYIKGYLENIRPRKVIITGGEPTLIHDLEYIAKDIKINIGARVYLQTNGFGLNKKGNLKADLFDNINLSCDHYFNYNAQNIELHKIVENNSNLTLSYVVYKRNIDKYYRFVEYAASVDLPILINHMAPLGKAKRCFNEMLDNKEKIKIAYDTACIIRKNYCSRTSDFLRYYLYPTKKCGAYGNKITIFNNGDIGICQSTRNEKYIIGNLFQKSNFDFTAKMNIIYKNEGYKFMVDEDIYCRNCAYRYFCGGVCNITKEEMAKDIDEVKEYIYPCEYAKTVVEFNLFHRGNNTFEIPNNFIRFIDGKL